MTRRVIADRQGGVMVMFALAAMMLVLFVGLVIDSTRLWMVQVKLQQSVDAAALLAVKQIDMLDQPDPEKQKENQDK